MVYALTDDKDGEQFCFEWVRQAKTPRPDPRHLSKLLVLLKPPKRLAEQIFIDASRHAEGRTRRQAYPTELLHITLLCIGYFRTLPHTLTGRVQKAMDGVSARPVPVILDKSTVFGNRTNLVLKSSHDTFKINGLAKVLQRQLRQQNLPFVPMRPFVPHMTTIYGCRKIDVMPIDQPYCWTADDFELVFSHNGETRHEALGCWALSPEARRYERPAQQLYLPQ